MLLSTIIVRPTGMYSEVEVILLGRMLVPQIFPRPWMQHQAPPKPEVKPDVYDNRNTWVSPVRQHFLKCTATSATVVKPTTGSETNWSPDRLHSRQNNRVLYNQVLIGTVAWSTLLLVCCWTNISCLRSGKVRSLLELTNMRDSEFLLTVLWLILSQAAAG